MFAILLLILSRASLRDLSYFRLLLSSVDLLFEVRLRDDVVYLLDFDFLHLHPCSGRVGTGGGVDEQSYSTRELSDGILLRYRPDSKTFPAVVGPRGRVYVGVDGTRKGRRSKRTDLRSCNCCTSVIDKRISTNRRTTTSWKNLRPKRSRDSSVLN